MFGKKLIGAAGDAIFAPIEVSNGISSFKSLKFYLVLSLYLVSMIFFTVDPFFANKWGEFSYNQSAIILFSSLIIMAALHWDILLFGKPAGANLLLQLTSIMPFMLFYARIMGASTTAAEEGSWLGNAIKWASDGVKMLTGFSMPNWITEIFSHWQCNLVLVLVLVVLCFRNTKIRISGLIVILLVPFFGVITNSADRWYLLVGTVFMLAGLALQFNNYASHIYYLNIFNRLKERKTIDEKYLRTIIRIMKKIDEEDRILENEVLDIVKSEYCNMPDLSQADVRVITGEVLRNMMNEFNLISMKLTHNGIVAMANYKLYNTDNFLSYIATLPRIVVILFITLIFVLSPVDIIPDALPLVGVLDDMALTLVSFFVTKNSLETNREK